ncbi:MAG: HEPN domain-containing protein [Acidobacteriota bacterium]|nr:HEPN domain-containing protein [Acidobacteriota bacterium]
MNRSDLQRLADVRFHEAQTLFTAGAFEGAYYLAGYAIECALKACVAKQTREFDFADKRLVERSYSHNLTQLLEVAGVQVALEEAIASSQAFRESWSFVKKWSEASRYALDVTEKSAQDMLAAVGNETSGVLPWLKKYW